MFENPEKKKMNALKLEVVLCEATEPGIDSFPSHQGLKRMLALSASPTGPCHWSIHEQIDGEYRFIANTLSTALILSPSHVTVVKRIPHNIFSRRCICQLRFTSVWLGINLHHCTYPDQSIPAAESTSY